MSESSINEITGAVIDAAMTVHSHLGPGLIESAYVACLDEELRHRGYVVETQVPVPIRYREKSIATAYRIDLLVERAVVVECKAVQKLAPIHEVQLLSHLRLGCFHAGLLINFHELHLRDGIRRMVSNL
jgi:GxxExxY protein